MTFASTFKGCTMPPLGRETKKRLGASAQNPPTGGRTGLVLWVVRMYLHLLERFVPRLSKMSNLVTN